MDEIYIGFIIVVIVILTIKTINIYHNYKNTIYPQIYSGFIEFLYRKASIKRLSTSSWLEQNFGFHRILYYLEDVKNKKVNKLFVIIILSSGIYIINSKNLRGRLYLDKSKKFKFVTSFVNKQTKEYGNKTIDLPNIVQETDNFAEKVYRITNVDPIEKIVQFLDDTQIDIKDSAIPIVCSQDVYKTIESIHKKKITQFNENKIENIYNILNQKMGK